MYKHLRSVTSALQLGLRQALEGGGVPSEFRGIALSWLVLQRLGATGLLGTPHRAVCETEQ